MVSSGGINVLNLETRKTTAIPLNFPPSGITFNPTGRLAYVSGLDVMKRFTAPYVAIIDVPNQRVLGQAAFDVAYIPGQIALSSDGSTLYLGNGTSVLAINATTLAAITTISFPGAVGYSCPVCQVMVPLLSSAGPYLLVGFQNELALVDTSTNTIANWAGRREPPG